MEAQLSEQGRGLAGVSEGSEVVTGPLRTQKEYVGRLEARLSGAETQLTWIKATLQGPSTYPAEDRPTRVYP